MPRSHALEQIRSLAFSTALLAALLGFGVFFDSLADRHQASQPDTLQAATPGGQADPVQITPNSMSSSTMVSGTPSSQRMTGMEVLLVGWVQDSVRAAEPPP